ncbi:hypothetical protein PE067_19840 [Paracoccus sp. DMF-8]|uniref:hypothetical protein n=1 Tax=Paracoccus sp. DMF-8 TaxID=3019445 RepID=UPI0023E39E4D|nr:hypothetical protein [Paracoccus sp. DMF-8]MDF3608192.1 hypothetical protein [Paracoccus sp. DMF-8]
MRHDRIGQRQHGRECHADHANCRCHFALCHGQIIATSVDKINNNLWVFIAVFAKNERRDDCRDQKIQHLSYLTIIRGLHHMAGNLFEQGALPPDPPHDRIFQGECGASCFNIPTASPE